MKFIQFTNKLIHTLIILIMAGLLSCSSNKNLSTVKNVDLEKYSGTWYEIARLPNSFEKGLKCITANYEILDNGKVKVVNKGHLIEDEKKVSEATGKAYVPDKSEPGRLKVTFFWPFYAKYYIIELDKDYQYALVGSPSRKYLWILARTKSIDDALYNNLLNFAEEKGFDTSSMIKPKHDCN